MRRLFSEVFARTQPVTRTMGNRGFTLVELMVAMAVGAIVMAAVMTAFLSQHRSYLAQDDVVEIQQNARVALDMLVRDIRSAGYDPDTLGAGITTAAAQTLKFTRGDGAGGLETIEYSLFDAFVFAVPPSNDGLIDDLARQTTSATGTTAGRQVVAENINQLQFRYLDENGAVTLTLDDILSIQVSLMVQTPSAAVNGPPAQTYTTPSGATWTSTPGFRSRYLSTTVQCRNLGL